MTRTHIHETLVGTNAPPAIQHQGRSLLSLNCKMVQLAQVSAEKHVSSQQLIGRCYLLTFRQCFDRPSAVPAVSLSMLH